ncbi:hypothetical protein J6590_052845 [Homalodisca vitripennis]|nr:hypothetical protein J6590_052845 [Homalodisca vitripennis]
MCRYSEKSIVLIKCVLATDRIWTCAIYNSDPKSDVTDRVALDYPISRGIALTIYRTHSLEIEVCLSGKPNEGPGD